MAAEQPSPAWHPALMPDHEDPSSSPDAVREDPGSSPPASPDSLHNGTPLEPEPEPQTFDLAAADSGNGDSWFAKEDGEHDDGGAWLATEQPSLHGVDADQQHVAASHLDGPASESGTKNIPTTTHAQHSSSMSFARTVSHEISFPDDDDGDWNLSRTNTDPFKFMPPSDRTNSFPVVPPMDSNTDYDNQPLPSNQALDVLEETERDSSYETHQYYTGTSEQLASGETETTTPAHTRSGHAPSRSIGGEVPGFEGESADARYEEGVPLISGADHHDPDQETHGSGPFAEDDNDDFFAQVNDGPSSNGQGTPPQLERKSTSQVLSAFGPGSLSREDTLETTFEEDETTQTSAQVADRATGNIDEKWKEAFGDDDDDGFLLDDAPAEGKDFDPTAFLGSDDEGLLDDTEDDSAAPQPLSGTSQHFVSSFNTVPQQAPGLYGQAQAQSTPFQPSNTPYYNPPAPTNAFGAAPQYGRPLMPGSTSDSSKAQSFADKSKGGYSSPYDLPLDIASSVPKPRKRPSTQSLRSPSTAAPPPSLPNRSVSAAVPGPLLSTSRPPSSHDSQELPSAERASASPLRNKSSFFEELPMNSKPRPASRHSNGAPSPSQYAPPVPPTASQMPPPPPPASSSIQHLPAQQLQSPGMPNLVAPERVSPYAALQNSGNPPPGPPANNSRYSPAPAQAPQAGPVPAASGSRYSPAPTGSRPLSGYSPTRASAATPPILPHQPRTSSPLAHFETHSGKTGQGSEGHIPHLAERRSSSSSYEPRLHRVSSLPPTREVDEEDDQSGAGASLARQTPPPSATHSAQSTLSPPKRAGSNYMPQPSANQTNFAPPPRSQTQSPGATYGNRAVSQTSDTAARPSSSHAPTSPVLKKAFQPSHVHPTRGRGQSLTMNMVPPTDGREKDPLQRWKGVPIIAWGVGGTVVTSFPKSIPRYTMGASTPGILRVPGEVNIKNIKEIDPLPERLAKFPGPLKGKSKKKETIAWLTSGIDTLEKDLPDVSFHPELSLEAKRGLERLFLWKILRIFIENDGSLEGTPAVEKAVRDVLSPGTITPTSDNDAMFPGDPRLGNQTAPVTSMQADGADNAAMEQIRLSLLKGDREAAVWSAVDKRLWGHAMVLANTVNPGLYKKVSQEFVRKEVNFAGHANESLGALYMVLSGNHDECVDELVPSHARAGLQLLSTETSSGPTRDLMDGLDKWRESLTLILSNRSVEDVRGLQALGKLLASYGRAEAAHICFLFSRNISVFGGAEEPNVNFVLLGSDLQHQENETEALQLTEVYEYGLSLAGGIFTGAPHLAAYKLHHAITLAEYGYREKALQYCDAIVVAMTSQTKRSPYYNSFLAGAVDDFMVRLKQAPKGESSSWISKPSMNKVSDSMWSKFNKFVAGDDTEGGTENGPGPSPGPFAAISTTPNLSRSPSVNNFEMYGGGQSNYAPAPVTAAASKYAPGAAPQMAVTPSSYEPPSQYASQSATSTEYPAYPGQAQATRYPGSPPVQNGGFAPSPQISSYQPLAQPDSTIASGGYQPYSTSASASMPVLNSTPLVDHERPTSQGYSPPSYGYEPPQLNTIPPEGESHDSAAPNHASGYEPPSTQTYGYEPPSYQPDLEVDDDGAPKPKPKSFMNDDDDIPALKTKDKGKSDKDRENEEMFRKAAEEDAKRAAEQLGNKKGWGFGGWFGKRAESPKPGPGENPKAVRANLGEASSFVYDPDLKRWVNKKPGADNVVAKTATPPPPRTGPRPSTATPPPSSGTPPPPMSALRSTSGGGPPPRSVPTPGPTPELRQAASIESLGLPPLAPPMSRSASNTSVTGGPPSAPPSRPTTSMSNASSIDDLLGAPGPRKGGSKKPRKSGRYVDVMANT